MTLNKIQIAHIVSELLIVASVAFYFHKKYTSLQTQVQELTAKLEKLQSEKVSVMSQKQEQFETQTTQQINKLWNAINQSFPSMYGQPEFQQQFQRPQRPMFVPQFHVDPNESVKENYRSPKENSSENQSKTTTTSTKTETTSTKPETAKPKENKPFNPIQSALSMIGPLTTMFQIAGDAKTPHPNEIFQNVNIEAVLQKPSSAKIVEVEDDTSTNEIPDDQLDKELEQELQELCTPMISPNRFDNRSVQRFSESIVIAHIDLPTAPTLPTTTNADEQSDSGASQSPSQTSSPLRFISASEVKKTGRKKRVQAKLE